MSDFDSDIEQFDDQIKDPTYKSKTTVVEVTDRSTRQGQSGSNMAKTDTKSVKATGSKATDRSTRQGQTGSNLPKKVSKLSHPEYILMQYSVLSC